MFADALDKNQAFKDFKNNCLWKKQNYNFSKEVSSSFSSKIWNFLNVSFYKKYAEKKYLVTFSLENKAF